MGANVHPALLALAGTGFTFLMTTMGSAIVFFFKGKINEKIQMAFLGFASGVMIAASVWSLLIPAIDQVEAAGGIGWLPAAGGFLLGTVFLWLLDTITPHLHADGVREGPKTSMKRTTLLLSAVTLHNIPEGMAVGLAFALAAQQGGGAAYTAAIALAVGIGIQNFPEGAAISLPMRQEGVSRTKAFLYGTMSGVVEPIFGVLAVLVAGGVAPLMPWLLSFAAGAMIYVVVEELIPSAHGEGHTNAGTIGVILGFVIMMILDVALG